MFGKLFFYLSLLSQKKSAVYNTYTHNPIFTRSYTQYKKDTKYYDLLSFYTPFGKKR